jgi:hypothetical protein
MPRSLWVVALILVATPVQAAQIWAMWELDLGAHAPPVAFVLSATSPSGAPVPPDMRIPWQQCALTGQPAGTYCAPIGCPTAGVYEFQVRAQFAEGLSDPSNTFRCTLIPPGGCNCVDALLGPVPVVPPPPVPVPIQPVGLGTPPPLPQRSAEGLGLLPIGPLPAIPQVPTMPSSAAT